MSKIEVIQDLKYKFDGVEYDSYEEANKVYLKSIESQVNHRVKVFCKKMQNQKKRPFGSRAAFVVDDKYGPRLFVIESFEDLENVSFKILKERFNGQWYIQEDDAIAEKIVNEQIKEAAYFFLMEHLDSEYSNVEVKAFEKI